MTYEQHVAEAERLLVKSYGHDGNTNLQEPKWHLEDRNTR